eukprot:TRINITY_DN7847_c0_g1_i2.p1 TRINITY_DN7847_c0_g1~~TRINITY_DN7847_c0_g1_i2.p1  ORF type:complete len:131 (-),score=8.60 TRINITY_DN7847_c0_g1_i2:2910-3302(-)
MVLFPNSGSSVFGKENSSVGVEHHNGAHLLKIQAAAVYVPKFYSDRNWPHRKIDNMMYNLINTLLWIIDHAIHLMVNLRVGPTPIRVNLMTSHMVKAFILSSSDFQLVGFTSLSQDWEHMSSLSPNQMYL